MPVASLHDLRMEYVEFAASLGQTVSLSTSPKNDGSAHIETRGHTLYYVCTERGSELLRRETSDWSELLYWLLSDLTFSIASAHELAHRRSGEDSRRQLFAKHLELLRRYSDSFAGRREAELQDILRSHPYQDENYG